MNFPTFLNQSQSIFYSAIRILTGIWLILLSTSLYFRQSVPIIRWGEVRFFLIQPLPLFFLILLTVITGLLLIANRGIKFSATMGLLVILIILDYFKNPETVDWDFTTMVAHCWIYWLTVLALTHLLIGENNEDGPHQRIHTS